MAEETVLLHFEVDQSKAERDLVKIEKILLQNREAQQELTKAYKAGTITQEEYVQENLRLQQNIAKEQTQKKALVRALDTESNSRNSLRSRIGQLTKEYDNLNVKTTQGAKRADELEKELKQLNEQLNKGSKAAGNFKDNIGNYPEQLGDAAKSINVAGVSVGGLIGQFTALANPVTAAAGLITALGTAYINSTSGARDFQKAQDLVGNSIDLLSESFADFIGQTEDGEGFLSRITETILFRYAPAIAAAAKGMANAEELLRDLEISRSFAAGDAKDSERRAELQRRIRDEEKKTLDERIAASEKIDSILNASGERTKIVIEAQIKAVQESTVNYDLNRDAQLRVAQLTAEIADKEEEITGKLTENKKARQTLIDLRREELNLLAMEIREANAPKVDLSAGPVVGDALGVQDQGSFGNQDPIIEQSQARQAQFIAELKTVEQTEAQKRAERQRSLDFEIQVDQARLNAAKTIFSALSQLAQEGSNEQRALALAAIAIDTAQALTSGIASSQDIPYPGNLVAMATTIATILSNIASAAEYIDGFKEGGWTGPGDKNKAVGVVHADEYVTPKHIVNAPAARPHLAALESMRVRGYADGGFVTNQATASSNQSLITANALKALPRPILDVREVTSAQDRITIRENAATL